MNLWRLEWLRLVRTRRLLVMVGVYVFFGLTGPLTARYLSQIVARFATSGVRVEFPTPVPADGIIQFVGNTTQIGLLTVVMVAASALAIDARREMAVFLRTRVSTIWPVILAAYVVNTAAAVSALLLGSLAAWYETAVLLGRLPVAAMLAGIGYGALFLAFSIAVAALVAGVVRGVLATAGVTLVTLLSLSLVGTVTGLERWLPTGLAAAMGELVRGTSPARYLPAAAIAVLAGAGAILAGARLSARREL